jgi:hypothetical protein
LEGRDQEDYDLRLPQAKSLWDTHLNQWEDGLVAHTCHPSYEESINRRISE